MMFLLKVAAGEEQTCLCTLVLSPAPCAGLSTRLSKGASPGTKHAVFSA